MSPTHLLRKVFDECRSFAEAMSMISKTPLCIPAIFTLAGPGPGDATVIERTMEKAYVPSQPVAANHWASQQAPPGRPRNGSSRARHSAMCGIIAGRPEWSMSWLREPVVQPDTRVAVMANPQSGRLLVQGWEATGPVTNILELTDL